MHGTYAACCTTHTDDALATASHEVLDRSSLTREEGHTFAGGMAEFIMRRHSVL